MRRGIRQSAHGRVCAELDRTVSMREPAGKCDPDAAQQRDEVAGPRYRHRDIANGVLKDQVPADDPRY